MTALDKMDNAYNAYSTMVVLPTGAGKTYTASKWLLRRALDREIKILWLAHRQMLLDQAAKSFIKFAVAAELPHITSFRYRIVSGEMKHDRAVLLTRRIICSLSARTALGRIWNGLTYGLKMRRKYTWWWTRRTTPRRKRIKK